MEKKNPCIVMVPSPGLSHLIPLVEFAKILTHDDDELHVKLMIPTLGPPSSSMNSILNKNSLPPNITFTLLPQVNVEDLIITDENPQPATQMQLTVKHSLPFLHQELTSLITSTNHNILAILFSLFSTDVLDLAKEFNLLSYVFFASGALFLSFCLHLPHLDDQQQQQHEHEQEESLLFHHQLTEKTTVHIPGCPVPFQVHDFPQPALSQRSTQAYKSVLGVCRKYSLVDGVLVNTFTDLEADLIRAIEDQANNRENTKSPFVYPIGPIIQSATSNQVNRLECLRWLDNQPPRSVLYISFGSGGTHSQEQLNEIAFGLELSGHKFLWVVRNPSNFGGSAYLNQQKEDPLRYLPLGFVDRTKEQGLVVPSWAPQVEILGHGSTGGFLSHCGWNSTLESIVHGVPMIAWPLFAEQRMNAVLLKEVLKVALMPEKVVDNDGDGIVKREEIARVIKRMMEENEEGLEIRKRIKHLSDAAAAALTQNGSSHKALSTLTKKWKCGI
ncbi:hydroquinone glucosyltransferase-like [Arachis stenosperma]|uniref:hydroquinone glucosyltransferase-like n=1 Tax=Arachis stenosperma TaxID=217475 RepID=UPI0025AD284D|nr:hydroquinone glucosyltransferase-like [Arachis stenosperma]